MVRKLINQQMMIMLLISDFFNKDTEKIVLWMETKNPMLGGVSPVEMIEMNRYEKLKEFVITSIAKNEKP